MKKFKLFLTACFSLLFFMQVVNLQSQTVITGNFPDDNFRAKVYELFGETPGTPIMDDWDFASIKQLDISNLGIELLNGISYFTDLEELNCSNNLIDALTNFPDGPPFTSTLKYLDCSHNQIAAAHPLPANLEYLDFSHNNMADPLDYSLLPLKHLNCSNNLLTALFPFPATLEYLDCSNNALTALHPFPSTLEYLDCSNNALNGLHPLTTTALKYANISNNVFTGMPGLPASIEYFNFSYNQIPFFSNLAAWTSIKEVYGSNNIISGFFFRDFSPTLEKLDLSYNNLSGLGLASVDINYPNLKEINCSNNNLTALPFSTYFSALEYLDCRYNRMTSLSAITGVEHLVEGASLLFHPSKYISIYFADQFVTWLGDNWSLTAPFTQEDLNTAIEDNSKILNVSNAGLYSLDGLQYFDGLEEIDCSGNNLGGLPTLPTSLLVLNCSNNVIEGLPFLPTSLLELDCSNNLIEGLPELPGIIPGPGLLKLNCSNNPLTDGIVIEGMPNLPESLLELRCSGIGLTGLPTLTDNLTYLDCSNNLLPGLPTLTPNITHLDCSNNLLPGLPTFTGNIKYLDCSNNLLTGLPSWTLKFEYIDISNNQLTGLNWMIGLSALEVFKCANNQLTALHALPGTAGQPGVLKEIDCSGNLLGSISAGELLVGYEMPPGKWNEGGLPGTLEIFNCSQNYLTNLDVSDASLTLLDCRNNFMNSTDDVTGADHLILDNTFLFEPQKNDNIADKFYPPFLAWLRANWGVPSGPFTHQDLIDVIDAKTEKMLDVSSVGLWAIDGLEYFTGLEKLYCNDNNLGGLPDLPKTLKVLDCSNNAIEGLPKLPGVDSEIPGSGLVILNCSNNPLTDGIIPVGLPVLPETLQELYCSHIGLTALPDILPANLQILHCDNNQLIGLPTLPGIAPGPGLEILYCSNNPLAALPDPLPGTLKILDCSATQLTALPAPLPPALEYLDCSYNSLAKLPTLPNLEYLDCQHNQIDTLPQFPETLQYLYCNNNLLKELPTFTNLIKLDCSSNQLTALPTFPETLEYLHCSYNQLTGMPWIVELPLTEFNCSGNLLTQLPILPTTLVFLFCSDNLLTEINVERPEGLLYLDCHLNYLTSENMITGLLPTTELVFDPQNTLPLTAEDITLWVGVEETNVPITSGLHPTVILTDVYAVIEIAGDPGLTFTHNTLLTINFVPDGTGLKATIDPFWYMDAPFELTTLRAANEGTYPYTVTIYNRYDEVITTDDAVITVNTLPLTAEDITVMSCTPAEDVTVVINLLSGADFPNLTAVVEIDGDPMLSNVTHPILGTIAFTFDGTKTTATLTNFTYTEYDLVLATLKAAHPGVYDYVIKIYNGTIPVVTSNTATLTVYAPTSLSISAVPVIVTAGVPATNLRIVEALTECVYWSGLTAEIVIIGDPMLSNVTHPVLGTLDFQYDGIRTTTTISPFTYTDIDLVLSTLTAAHVGAYVYYVTLYDNTTQVASSHRLLIVDAPKPLLLHAEDIVILANRVYEDVEIVNGLSQGVYYDGLVAQIAVFGGDPGLTATHDILGNITFNSSMVAVIDPFTYTDIPLVLNTLLATEPGDYTYQILLYDNNVNPQVPIATSNMADLTVIALPFKANDVEVYAGIEAHNLLIISDTEGEDRPGLTATIIINGNPGLINVFHSILGNIVFTYNSLTNLTTATIPDFTYTEYDLVIDDLTALNAGIYNYSVQLIEGNKLLNTTTAQLIVKSLPLQAEDINLFAREEAENVTVVTGTGIPEGDISDLRAEIVIEGNPDLRDVNHPILGNILFTYEPSTNKTTTTINNFTYTEFDLVLSTLTAYLVGEYPYTISLFNDYFLTSSSAILYVHVPPCPETIWDEANGIEYEVVYLAGRCWFKENLRNTVYQDGTLIEFAQPYFHSIYPDIVTNEATFGLLYTHASATENLICPEYWHIPTTTEWMLLSAYVASDLMEKPYWLEPNDNTNDTHFSVRGAGYFNSNIEHFEDLYGYTAFWSADSPAPDSNTCISIVFSYFCNMLEMKNIKLNNAISVRCIRDL